MCSLGESLIIKGTPGWDKIEYLFLANTTLGIDEGLIDSWVGDSILSLEGSLKSD